MVKKILIFTSVVFSLIFFSNFNRLRGYACIVRGIYGEADEKKFVHARGLKNHCQCKVYTDGKTCLGFKGIPEKVINSFVKEGILSWSEDNLNDYPLDESTDFDDVKILK